MARNKDRRAIYRSMAQNKNRRVIYPSTSRNKDRQREIRIDEPSMDRWPKIRIGGAVDRSDGVRDRVRRALSSGLLGFVGSDNPAGKKPPAPGYMPLPLRGIVWRKTLGVKQARSLTGCTSPRAAS